MTDITIPREALEAALEAFAYAFGLGILSDDEYDEEWREDLQNGMRAACIAMLRAWPGSFRSHAILKPNIVLPLPTENTNDKG